MLKRQRPVSPPPSIPSIPLIVDADIMTQRDLKRKRVLPPILDGGSRGWGRLDHQEDEEDEEYTSERDDTGDTGGNRPEDQNEYKQANNVLHELHTLHQHRLIFAPHVSQDFPYHKHSAISSILPPDIQHRNFGSDAYTSERPISQDGRNPGPYSEVQHMGSHTSKDEVLCVTERYEDTNKFSPSLSQLRMLVLTFFSQRLLGSLFLSRRRQLHSLEDHPLNP